MCFMCNILKIKLLYKLKNVLFFLRLLHVMLYELLYSIATLEFILDTSNYICHGKFLAVHLIPINCQLLTSI